MPTTTFGFARRYFAPAALAVLAAGPAGARADELDSVMYAEPKVAVARVANTFPAGIAELWSAALERPDGDLRGGAALAIAQAHEAGAPGLAGTAPALIRLLDRPDERPVVRAAVARALVALDARDAAPAFLRLATAEDPDLADIIEPALARWDHKPARDLWLARIGHPPPHRRGVLLAVRCLGTVRDDRAAGRLRELALSADAAPPVRLAAAGVLGDLRPSGSEADARALSGDGTPAGRTGRLAAARLLRRHAGAEAARLLQGLCADADSAVALTAVTRLSELGTAHVLPVLTAVVTSDAAEVRAHGVAALIQTPSDESVRALTGFLSDPHPDVRAQARRGLRELAADRRTPVIDGATRLLNAADGRGPKRIAWRGQEQAAILLAQLDHKPAAPRLAELLKTDRPEVAVAVGWGLRRLAVPDTLPQVLTHLKDRHAALLRSGSPAALGGVTHEALDRQLSQLVQFIGQARYREADPALRALVPRVLRAGTPPLFLVQPVFTRVGPETRAAALWALGSFYGEKPDDPLVALIEGRLIGDGVYGPDDRRVQHMAAVALGRTKAKRALPTLRAAGGTKPSAEVVPNACRWAIGQITHEPVSPPGVVEVMRRDWFLLPDR